MYGAIEAGGTKFICSIGNEKLDIIKQVSFVTTCPEETMPLVINFFKSNDIKLKSIGVGCFGPINLDRNSEKYGYITSTPKMKWRNFDFLGALKAQLDVPIVWTTDVNSACYGEYTHGVGQGLTSIAYYTIGTGVGGSVLKNDKFINGFSHPEMGHMLVNSHPNDTFEGCCPFHTNCLEGMASGLAIAKRFGLSGQNLIETHDFWQVEADYLAQCAYNTTLMFSPDKIIFGGGVMNQDHLIMKIREKFSELLNSYVEIPIGDDYLVTPKLGGDAGSIGCLALARDMYN